MSRKKKSPVSVVLVLLVCAVLWYLQNGGELSSEGESAVEPSPSGGEPAEKVGGYERFEGCRLVDYRNNDGDSFKVCFPNGEEHEMRLYFVDAPESAVKEYRDGNSNRKRISYQGKDLGGLSERETVAVGQEAKEWTKKVLKGKPFTVSTKWQEVFRSERYFGFVEIGDAGEQRFLHELLVERGLARVYTEGAKLPSGTTKRAQEQRLKELERKARASRAGACGK